MHGGSLLLVRSKRSLPDARVGDHIPQRINELITIGTEARVRDLTLAQALGYKGDRMIRRLIKNHMPMLEQFGLVCRVSTPITSGKGRVTEVTEFHLNRKQAIYLTTQAGTPKARAMTVLVVEVFDKLRFGFSRKI